MEVVKRYSLLELNINVKEDLKKLYYLDNGRMEHSIEILEEWVKKQAHFANKNMCGEYLESALFRCKGSVEKVKSQIDKLCTYKTLLPKYFVSDCKPILGHLNGLIKLVTLPKMTKDHDRVCYVQPCFKDRALTSLDLLYIIQYNFAVGEYLLHFDCMKSFIMIFDLRDADLLKIITNLSPNDLHNFILIVNKGFGARVSAVHLISSSNFIDLLLNTVIPILSSKLAARIRCHASVEDLCKILDRDILPTDFGGKQGFIDDLHDKWVKLLCSDEFTSFLTERVASCTDESLRQKDTFHEDCMGLPGSFRSLSVD